MPILVLLLQLSLGCASAPPPQVFTPTRERLAGLDEFGMLLVTAGLSSEAVPSEPALSATQARRLRLEFDLNPPRTSEYAPWVVADYLLRDVMQKKEGVSREELSRRVQTFSSLYVLRRDGCLARALGGKPAQCVGPVEVRDDALRAGEFEVDHFYRLEGRQWLPVTSLEPVMSASAQ